MGIIAWVIFGGLAGWVASMIMGTNERMGCLLNVIVGIVGAFLGGLIVELLSGDGFSFDFDLVSFIVAVVGAVVLLFIVGLFQRRRA